MDTTTVRQEEFGYEHGLMHEFIVTGRTAGATRDFYTKMAHDENLFRRVLGLIYEGDETPTTPEVATDIMGDNFYGIDAVERKLYEQKIAL